MPTDVMLCLQRRPQFQDNSSHKLKMQLEWLKMLLECNTYAGQVKHVNNQPKKVKFVMYVSRCICATYIFQTHTHSMLTIRNEVIGSFYVALA
jgi:hypothetical protein